MNYDKYVITEKAIELYRKKLQADTLKAIERQNQVGSIYWRVFRKYSITGFGETASIDNLTEAELLNQILMIGVTQKELNPFIEKATELWEEWQEEKTINSKELRRSE